MSDFVKLRARLRELTADGWKSLDDASGPLEADSVIFWAEDSDSAFLESVYAPLSPKLLGFRQSLASGLISQVFVSGMPLLEKDVKEQSKHDPAMDEQTKLFCRSMIAAPVSRGGRIIGVISAVRFDSRGRGDAFSLRDLDQLVEVSRVLASDLGEGEEDHVV